MRSIDIPNTWYTFSSRFGNNRMIIETEMGRRALCKHSIFEIIIPDGNYDAIQLSNLSLAHKPKELSPNFIQGKKTPGSIFL